VPGDGQAADEATDHMAGAVREGGESSSSPMPQANAARQKAPGRAGCGAGMCRQDTPPGREDPVVFAVTGHRIASWWADGSNASPSGLATTTV